MTLQQAKQAVADGQRIREQAQREKQRLDDEEAKRVQESEEKRRREFVERYFDRMVKALDARIEAAAHCGQPSATVGIRHVDPNSDVPPQTHESALLEALRAHYAAKGFQAEAWRPNDDCWGSVEVSGWLESPCG